MPEEIKKDNFEVKHASHLGLWIALAGLLVISLVLVFYQVSVKQTGKADPDQSGAEVLVLAPQISELPASAFGTLNNVSSAGQSAAQDSAAGARSFAKGGGLSVQEGAISTGGASGGAPVPADRTVSSSGAVLDSKIAMPYNPEPISYNYLYEGEALNLADATLPVYRRVKGGNSTMKLGEIIDRFDIGLIDWARFQEANLNSLSLSEDTDFGYNLDMNFAESTLSLSQNWQKWPHPEQACQDEACFRANRLTMADVLPDDEVLSIAKNFITGLGINTADYGEAEIQYAWREDYAKATDQANYYIPEEMGVIFPQKIKGQTVYESFGGKAGLMVSVNYKNKKVSSAYNLTSQNYEESQYDAMTDTEAVMSVLKKGGFQNYIGFMSENKEAKQVDVKLGTPTKELVKYYNYNEKTFVSEELFVPALVFPITNLNEVGNNFYRKSIIIPLAKEIFAKENNVPAGGVPVMMKTPSASSASDGSGIMPMETGAQGQIAPDGVAGGVSGSAGMESAPIDGNATDTAPSPM